LQASALVEEESSNHEAANRLFDEAMALVKEIGLAELAHTVAYTYGTVLDARGEYKTAAEHYRMAAEFASKSLRPVI
jgi:tetratricopeptide (TPR) repeat protein